MMDFGLVRAATVRSDVGLLRSVRPQVSGAAPIDDHRLHSYRAVDRRRWFGTWLIDGFDSNG
jgi:hypothetical protein